MKKILQALTSALNWIKSKLSGLISTDNVDAAYKIINTLKEASGTSLASWISSLDKTGISATILSVIKTVSPKLLSTLTIIKELPENPTQEQLEELFESVTGIVLNGTAEEKARFYTSFGAMVIVTLEDGKVTFGEAAALLEAYYQEKNK